MFEKSPAGEYHPKEVRRPLADFQMSAEFHEWVKKHYPDQDQQGTSWAARWKTAAKRWKDLAGAYEESLDQTANARDWALELLKGLLAEPPQVFHSRVAAPTEEDQQKVRDYWLVCIAAAHNNILPEEK